MTETLHTRHHGLAADLRALVARRRVLGFGAGGLAMLAGGCDMFGPPGDAEANRTATAADGSVCIKTPAETNGPFPADGSNSAGGSLANVLTQEGIVREDVRGSFGTGSGTADGVRLDMELALVDVANACTPLAGHLVYIWHCDAAGKYSIYELAGTNYLRGAGITDAAGVVRFTTVFPGCYRGRWPHIHFEVFSAAGGEITVKDSVLVSQFAMPGNACRNVYERNPAYAASVQPFGAMTLESDGIFNDNTPEQLAAQTLRLSDEPGGDFRARATIGILKS